MTQVLLTLGGYSIVAFLFNLLDESMPLFASAPLRVHGLNLSTSQLAVPLMVGGASIIFFAFYGYPRVQVGSWHVMERDKPQRL